MIFIELSLFLSCIVLLSYADNSRSYISQLSLDFLKILYNKKDNLFYSPTSISTLMAIVLSGTAGDTRSEVLKGLYDGLSEKQVHADHKSLMEMIKSSPKVYEISIANAVYGNKGFAIKQQYLEQLKNLYNTTLFQRNLALEATRLEINRWVGKVTKNKIEDLIKPGVLSHLSRLVLINAIYFKANWQNQFNVKKTNSQKFYVKPNVYVMIPMMHQDVKTGYFENDKYEVISLPYDHETMSMIILLPKKRFGLANSIKDLTASALLDIVSKLRKQDIALSMPKMKIKTSLELASALKDVGVRKLFQEGDFSKISNAPLSVSNVMHEAFIEVNEEGTEAAAATGVFVSTSELPVFSADHPFLFFIWHNKANVPLFSGALINPSNNGGGSPNIKIKDSSAKNMIFTSHYNNAGYTQQYKQPFKSLTLKNVYFTLENYIFTYLCMLLQTFMR